MWPVLDEQDYFLVDEIARALDVVKHVRQPYPLRAAYIEETFFLRAGPSSRRNGSAFRTFALRTKALLRRAKAHF
jgi:hypothetical protein